jgi:hypothetical protein
MERERKKKKKKKQARAKAPKSMLNKVLALPTKLRSLRARC